MGRKINILWCVSQCVLFDVVNELCSKRKPNTPRWNKKTNKSVDLSVPIVWLTIYSRWHFKCAAATDLKSYCNSRFYFDLTRPDFSLSLSFCHIFASLSLSQFSRIVTVCLCDLVWYLGPNNLCFSQSMRMRKHCFVLFVHHFYELPEQNYISNWKSHC